MTIEEDETHPPGDPVARPLVFQLLRIHEWFAESIHASGRALGLPPMTHAQKLLIGYIVMGERRPARLARSIGMSRQAVSLLVAQFVKEGVLTAVPDPQDARAQLVDLAPDSPSHLALVVRIAEQLETRVAARFGADRLAVVRHVFSQDWGEPIELDENAMGLPAATPSATGRRPAKR